MNRAAIVLVIAIVLLVMAALPLTTPGPGAEPDPMTAPSGLPSENPPAAPKTRAQIASEAYAIEATARASAGRKTDPANDGTGATTDTTFTSTADFDAGSKTNTETSTDTCNGRAAGEFGLSHTGNYLGISDLCIAGAPISTTSLDASYDFASSRSSKLKDFKGSNDCTANGGVTIGGVSGTYGQATQFDGSNDAFTCGAPTTPAGSFTIHVLMKPTAEPSLVVSLDATGNTYLDYGLQASGKITMQAKGHDLTGLTPMPVSTGVWTVVDAVYNSANSTMNLYKNGAWFTSKAMSGTITTWDQLHIGYYLSSLYYTGYLDELSIWDRALTGSEIAILASGASSYATSGSWKSASQGVIAETFRRVSVSYTGASANAYITSAYLFDSTAYYFFIDNSDLTTGTSHTYTVPNVLNPNTWKVGLNLTGNAASTTVVSSVAVAYGGGPGTTTGCAPNVAGMSCVQNSTWDQTNIRLCGQQVFTIDSVTPQLSLTITNAKIDGCGLDGVFKTTDSTTSEIYVWDDVSGMTYDISNSTIYNFTAATLHVNTGGNYRVGAQIVKLDNVTISDFDTFSRSNGAIERSYISAAHDSDISDYNRDDDSWCALDQQASSTTLGYSIERIHFTISNTIATGCAAGDDLRRAIKNVFDGGFLQITFGADFEHGVSPDFGSPTEFVNWSGNYANDSRHTVFGFYGTGTGNFADHMGVNAYGSIYGNYVNNSRYIPIQSSGNVSGLRIVGNYMRGPVPWPGGLPSFEIAILMGEQNHDSLVDNNYLWDMDDEHISGITVGFGSHDNVISNNVIYDVGSNHIRVEGQALKYKNPTDCAGPSGCSDYSWKGSNNILSGNYLSGGTGSRAISVDSGRVVFTGNTVVAAGTGTFLIREGLPCSPDCDFAWVDWIDGWPDTPTISWSGTIPPEDEGRFWVRTARTGILDIQGTPTVDITAALPQYGVLQTPRCVLPNSATGGRTTTDVEVLAYTGKSCGPLTDTTHFAGPGTLIAIEPETLYNKTLSLSFAKVEGHLQGPEGTTVRFQDVTNGAWTINPGQSYTISVRAASGPLVVQGLNVFWIGIFGFAMVLMVIGAWKIHKRFEE
jgi:hypothetical protein